MNQENINKILLILDKLKDKDEPRYGQIVIEFHEKKASRGYFLEKVGLIK